MEKQLKVICPCCGKEIIVEIDDIQNDNENELKKISKNLDIEFGMQNGGEKENE